MMLSERERNPNYVKMRFFRLAEQLRPGGFYYSAKGSMRRALEKMGLAVELPWPRKGEMIRAIRTRLDRTIGFILYPKKAMSFNYRCHRISGATPFTGVDSKES